MTIVGMDVAGNTSTIVFTIILVILHVDHLNVAGNTATELLAVLSTNLAGCNFIMSIRVKMLP